MFRFFRKTRTMKFLNAFVNDTPSISHFKIVHTEADLAKLARYEAKRAEAIAMLGSKWLLHPANKVSAQPNKRVLDDQLPK